MKIIKPILLHVCSNLNDKNNKRMLQNAKNIAFLNTGNRINNAKRHNTFVDGKKLFREEYRKQLKNANRKTNFFTLLISLLFS